MRRAVEEEDTKQPLLRITHEVLLQPQTGGRGNGEDCWRFGSAWGGRVSHNGGGLRDSKV
jgi:hypothetical protein